MSEPQSPLSTPPKREISGEQPEPSLPVVAAEEPPDQSPIEQVFYGPNGVRAGWRVSAYFLGTFLTAPLLMWFGASMFHEPMSGVAALWREMYEQAAWFVAALLAAILVGQLEERNIDDYGLPRRQALGKMFWIGAAWGLAAITLLLLLLRGTHAFYFGHPVLHGARVLRFALFWGGYFVLVGLFEEFLIRGYAMFTLSRSIGFWPAAIVLSIIFGGIHVRNPGETWLGLLGVVAIGMFFCLTLYRTGNLWFAVGFHSFWDWGQTYLYSVPDSGTMEPGHLMYPSFHGPDWLTGGSVGPEASVLCFVVIGLVGVAFARRYPVSNLEPSMSNTAPLTSTESTGGDAGRSIEPGPFT
jgi:CAAX protease family protein